MIVLQGYLINSLVTEHYLVWIFIKHNGYLSSALKLIFFFSFKLFFSHAYIYSHHYELLTVEFCIFEHFIFRILVPLCMCNYNIPPIHCLSVLTM